MSNRIKLQHYVPRFYLKAFAVKPKKNSIYCFNKSNSKYFPVSIKNVASESYFYDKPGEAEQKIEKVLSVIESSFKPIHSKIIASKDLGSLTPNERESIAYFVTMQEHRTREHRESIRDGMNQAKQRLYKEKLTDEFKERYGIDKWGSEEEAKATQLGTLKHIRLYSEILLQMKWILYINRTPMPLWSSDHPVNRYNHIDAKPHGNLGLLCKGIELHFPLSSHEILSFLDPSTYSLFPSIYEIKDIQNIKFENWFQVAHSTRYIFSDTSDFSLAEEILRNDPSLRSSDRKRVEVS